MTYLTEHFNIVHDIFNSTIINFQYGSHIKAITQNIVNINILNMRNEIW